MVGLAAAGVGNGGGATKRNDREADRENVLIPQGAKRPHHGKRRFRPVGG